MSLPLLMSRSELAEFNRFWTALEPTEQVEMQTLMDTVHARLTIARTARVGYRAYHALLLGLLLELYRERQRLLAEIERLSDGEA